MLECLYPVATELLREVVRYGIQRQHPGHPPRSTPNRHVLNSVTTSVHLDATSEWQAGSTIVDLTEPPHATCGRGRSAPSGRDGTA